MCVQYANLLNTCCAGLVLVRFSVTVRGLRLQEGPVAVSGTDWVLHSRLRCKEIDTAQKFVRNIRLVLNLNYLI